MYSEAVGILASLPSAWASIEAPALDLVGRVSVSHSYAKVNAFWGTCPAVVAEWLRRWTRNPMGSTLTGSNPVGCATFKKQFNSVYLILVSFSKIQALA